MEMNNEELVRVRIQRAGYRSSVSMDLFLANTLKEKLGGDAEFKSWIQETVDKLEREWEEKAADTKTGSRVHARSGLSRMVQREAIRRVLTK